MRLKNISIKDRQIGPGHPAFIIGEVALAHEGSLGMAQAFIDVVAAAGADAVKFQTHIAEAESTPQEKFRVGNGQDATRFDYWKRTEFTEDQWRRLAEYADRRKLIFLSSPFSVEAVELLECLGVPAWKVASGEVTNFPLLDKMLISRKPILLSGGMSPWDELDRTAEIIKKKKVPLGLFQCTTSYPCVPEEIGLNIMEEMRTRYSVPVGISDHSGKIYAGLAAASLGANMIEVHVTLSREMFGLDVPASLTPSELRQLVEGVRFIETVLKSPVDKDQTAIEKAELRKLFFHSVVAKKDLPAGTVLMGEHLATKKPGTGIGADRLDELVGRKLARDVRRNQLLAEEDFV